MADRTLPLLFLTTALALGNVLPARAEKLPEPPMVLKDYDGRGVVQLSMPSRGTAKNKNGDDVIDPGFSTWFTFRQTFVNPGRIYMGVNLLGALRATLVQDNVERTYAPSTGYVIETTYKNLEKATESPISTVQMAMSTYAQLLRDLDSGKILPAEDLDQIKERLIKRSEEVKKLREEFAVNPMPGNEPKAAAAAAEAARLRDDLEQLDLRKAHPCHVIEFVNKDLMQHLFTRGLMGGSAAELINKGKTTFWVTKAEGLPVKVETTANDGSVAVFMLFKDLRINTGLHPGEVVLGNPMGIRLFRTTADLRDKDWEEKMQEDLNAQISLYEKEKQRGNQPLTPRFPRNGSAAGSGDSSKYDFKPLNPSKKKK
jgi:hypothetical protein